MWTDGHCHPTDEPGCLPEIEQLDCRMALMSTGFEDLDLVAEQAVKYPHKVVPAFGLHPWSSHLLTTTPSIDKLEHYRQILEPVPEAADNALLSLLPEPISLDDHMERIRNLLVKYPHALLGEVGIDKAFKVKIDSIISKFRVKLDHQRMVLRRQLQLAAELHRSVSLHGVQAPHALFDDVALFAGRDRPIESRIGNVCLHSYGGSSDFYDHYWLKKLGVKVYVSVAVVINGKMQPQKLKKLLDGTRIDLILSESDYHTAGETQLDLVKQSAAIFANHFNMDISEMEGILERNFNSFISPD